MVINKKTVLRALVATLICGVALAGGSVYITPSIAETSTQAQIFEEVTPREALSLIEQNKANPDFVILDVRTPKEFASGHIKGAINLDYYAETFQEDLDGLDKTKTYLVYCRSGSRSSKAFNLMKELGFQSIYVMEGGIKRWNAEDLPTTEYDHGIL
jgi:rhodanese-related sulfurtransferase